MTILDANMILRFLIMDNKEMAVQVKEIIRRDSVLILPEVLAEVIYVMTKVYKIDRIQVANGIAFFLSYPNVETEKNDVIKKGIEYYEKTSLDFVDCLLCAYQTVSGYKICTFDKKLNNLIKRESQ